MGTGQKQTPRLADSRPESVHVPAKEDVILKHCRCMDCRNFSQIDGEYFCSEYIGGTKATWATGRRQCDPPPEAWHYCSHYEGPQISKAIWLWRRRSRHVCAGWAISCVVEQGYHQTPGANVGAHLTHLPTTNGSFLAAGAVTAAGTVAVLHTVCFDCPVFRRPLMEVHNGR